MLHDAVVSGQLSGLRFLIESIKPEEEGALFTTTQLHTKQAVRRWFV